MKKYYVEVADLNEKKEIVDSWYSDYGIKLNESNTFDSLEEARKEVKILLSSYHMNNDEIGIYSIELDEDFEEIGDFTSECIETYDVKEIRQKEK